jgi:hypothetical protein
MARRPHGWLEALPRQLRDANDRLAQELAQDAPRAKVHRKVEYELEAVWSSISGDTHKREPVCFGPHLVDLDLSSTQFFGFHSVTPGCIGN